MCRSSWGFSNRDRGAWLPEGRRSVTMIPALAYRIPSTILGRRAWPALVRITGSAVGIGSGTHTDGYEVSLGLKCEVPANAVSILACSPCLASRADACCPYTLMTWRIPAAVVMGVANDREKISWS